MRGVVPPPQDGRAFLRAQNVQAADRTIGSATSAVQQPQESLLTISKIRCSMKRRIGIEVDAERSICRSARKQRSIDPKPARGRDCVQ